MTIERVQNKETDFLSMSAPQLKDELIAVTVGGATGEIDNSKRALLFCEYVQRAFPKIAISSLTPFDTAVALNSIFATAEVVKEGKPISVFVKIHIESGTKSVSAVGVEGEYQNARCLIDAGLPVLAPIATSENKNYPLLMYPKVESQTLFTLLEASYAENKARLGYDDFALLAEIDKKIQESDKESFQYITPENARESMVQTLFLERFGQGKRVDEWYSKDANFFLPGIEGGIDFGALRMASWNINGVRYVETLEGIIAHARRVLSYDGEDKVAAIISHGDDHAGNVYVDRAEKRAFVFDPAFAGINPACLSHLKAFAHTGFLPMGGMYYNSRLKTCSYEFDRGNNMMKVMIDFSSAPAYEAHSAIAKSILEKRIVPLFERAVEGGIDGEKEKQRIALGLAGCALLTIHIGQLLERGDGRGVGLLPMTILCAELQGLPILDELRLRLQEARGVKRPLTMS